MDYLKMINILYEDNHLLVVEKEANIPVQEDSSKDLDLLTMLKQYIKDKYNKPGNVYLGLVHRLDRPVSGVMVFAKTSKAASRLSDQIRNQEINKTYLAVIDNVIDEKEGRFKDHLLKDENTNIVKVDPKGKESILEYKVLDTKENKTLVEINLITGRSHQIRVQFSSRNYPLYGDQKYNINAKPKEQIALLANKLSFKHPISKEQMNFELNKKDIYPWNLFK
jgi:23S rRNA pseudouridine1911/1915/1917 synthase